MGFPHRGLLRELRQSIRLRGHAPLASDIDLPRFTYLDSSMLRRLPIALFTLACRKSTGSSSPFCDGYCCAKALATSSGFFVRQRLYVMLPNLPVRLIRSRKPW